MELLLGDGDTFVHTIPFWTYAAEQWKSLRAPFWTPLIFGGYPFFAEPQASVFHPLKLLFLLFSPLAAVNLTILLYYSLAAFSMFLLAREEGLTPEASFLAGMSFAFCGFMIGHQGTTMILMTAASFPLLFYVLRRAVRSASYPTVLGGAGVVILLVMGGHPQLFFYALFYSLFYVAYLLFFVASSGQRGFFLRTVIAIYGLGALLSAFQLLPTCELMSHSTRRQMNWEMFSSGSLPPPSLLVSMISTRMTGIFPNEGSEAMLDVGLLVLLLAGLGWWLSPGKNTRFWTFLLIFGSILYLGNTTVLYRWMFWVPGYNLFRVPTRNGVAIDLALALLAGYGVNAIQRRGAASRPTRWIVLLSIPVIYYVCFYRMEERIFEKLWNAAAAHGDVLPWNLETVRLQLVPLLPLLLVMLAGMLLISYFLMKGGGGRQVALLVVVVVFTHFWEYRGWLFAAPAEEVRQTLNSPLNLFKNEGSFRIAFGSPYNWTAFIEKYPSDWHRRYVSIGGPNVNMLQGVASISGFAPLVPREYARLAGDMTTSGTVDWRFFSSTALNLLNVKYVLAPRGSLSFPEEAFSSLQILSSSDEIVVYRNPNTFGLFWGVRRVEQTSQDQFWTRLQDPRIDFSQVALFNDPEPVPRQEFVLPRRIEARYEGGNKLLVTAETEGPAFLASSHPYYPGWFAWIDGNRTRIFQVNGIFAGLLVPTAGTHTIVLRYIPVSFWLGIIAGIVSLMAFWAISRKDLLRFKGDGCPRG
ncbi:MAG: YfhO family protein [Acidobacteria bacterium]|nr:YfhO family protein [Acidobacteriota bacterium]